MKKNLDSFYLEYMGWIKTKNHLTLLSLEACVANYTGIYTVKTYNPVNRGRFIKTVLNPVRGMLWWACVRMEV
jgi:hypothetical protein